MLDDNLIATHAVQLPPSSGKCAPPDCSFNLYTENNMYAPPKTQWIWHPPPYTAYSGWAEVTHQKDPFGDEHFGAWFLYAKGSGVWYNIGKTINFGEHAEAFAHFNVRGNEEMCQAAAAAGYDTIQFTAHRDHTNYPCDTAGQYFCMNVEIVATKLKGTYACGTPGAPDPGVLTAGWHDKPCNCDNKLDETNCGRLIRSVMQAPTTQPARVRGPSLPRTALAKVSDHVSDPQDCSAATPTDPSWFSTCNKTSAACMRIHVRSALQTLTVDGCTTDLGCANVTSGYTWCIDHTNALVYAQMTGAVLSASYFIVSDDARKGAECQFLSAHWVYGDVVRVFKQELVNCSLSYDQLPPHDGITDANLTVV
jgi:hypothetical protein